MATEKDGQCHLTMHEHSSKGPAALIPDPVADPILHLRNTETLERLALLAEGRHV